jgi:hypothetical protein
VAQGLHGPGVPGGQVAQTGPGQNPAP